MSKILSTLSLSSFFERRSLYKYLKLAEDNKHSHLGQHYLKKARIERTETRSLTAEELANFDKRITEIAKLQEAPEIISEE